MFINVNLYLLKLQKQIAIPKWNSVSLDISKTNFSEPDNFSELTLSVINFRRKRVRLQQHRSAGVTPQIIQSTPNNPALWQRICDARMTQATNLRLPNSLLI